MPKRGRQKERSEGLKAKGRVGGEGEEDDKHVEVLVGRCWRNLLAGANSFVMRRDECEQEPRQWRVSCEVKPCTQLGVKMYKEREN